MRERLFDGRMIGLKGEVVTYPKWFFLILQNSQRILDRKAKANGAVPIRIIERDHESGFFRVLEPVREQLGPFLELPDYRINDLKALDPSFQSGKARISGRRGLVDLLETGIAARKEDDVDR